MKKLWRVDPRGRHQVLGQDGTVVRFRCCCGREYQEDMNGPRRPVHQRVKGDGLAFLVRYWSRPGASTGVGAKPCLVCRRTYTRTGKLPAKVAVALLLALVATLPQAPGPTTPRVVCWPTQAADGGVLMNCRAKMPWD